MSKPYISYNEYGMAMIRHPAVPVMFGVPVKQNINAKGVVEYTGIDESNIEELMGAMMSVADVEGDEWIRLKKEVVGLVLEQWEKQKLPSLQTIGGKHGETCS